jgi:SAM-dependent methyltransferase
LSNDRSSLPSTLYTEDYFLTACEGYEEFSESHGERLSRRLSAAFAVASVLPGMRVLDVGCGRGEILRHCARLGARAYGIDYAEVAVRMSREVARIESDTAGQADIGVYRSDAKYLPYPDATFDRALIFDVVEHLFPWESLVRQIRLSRRAAAPPAARQRRALSGQPARAERRRERRRARERAGLVEHAPLPEAGRFQPGQSLAG